MNKRKLQIGSMIVAALLSTTACSSGSNDSPLPSGGATPTKVPLGVHTSEELEQAAKQVVSFLRGEVGFESIKLADATTLHLSPEGGGDSASIPRDGLHQPSQWQVRSAGLDVVYSLAPPEGEATLTTRVGRHFNCMEYSLSSRSKELAAFPHVGNKLTPTGADSCLQSWNLTLVFDPELKPPTLIAAVYDQWEW